MSSDSQVFQVVFLHHEQDRYALPPDKAWQGGIGVWRARPDRLAQQDFAVFHDGETMWDAVEVRDAVPVPERHQARGEADPSRQGTYAPAHAAPRCVLIADPRLPEWLEAVLGDVMPLPAARSVVRYARVHVQATGVTWQAAPAE